MHKRSSPKLEEFWSKLAELWALELGGLMLVREGVTQEAPRLESERFAKDSSWFAGGIESYVKLLLEVPLP